MQFVNNIMEENWNLKYWLLQQTIERAARHRRQVRITEAIQNKIRTILKNIDFFFVIM